MLMQNIFENCINTIASHTIVYNNKCLTVIQCFMNSYMKNIGLN